MNISDILSDSIFNNYLNIGWLALTKNFKNTNSPSSTSLKKLKAKKSWEHLREVVNSKKKRNLSKIVLSINNDINDNNNLINKIDTNEIFDKKNCSKYKKELILKILGAFRAYVIENTIFEVKKELQVTYETNILKDNEFIAVGSTNITSDYDVTLLGPQSNEILWNMFLKFLTKYGTDLPEAFDSNLYSSPLYIHTSKYGKSFKINKHLNQLVKYKINGSDRYFTLVPLNKTELFEELTWATIKLIDLIPEQLTHLKKIEYNSKILKNKMEHLKNNLNLPYNEKEILNKYNDNIELKNIFINYYLQYISQKKCIEFIYNSENKIDNIFFYSNTANYYSSEAYYTSSAVNTIVVESQIGCQLEFGTRTSDIINGIYLCSIIENLGDFYYHSIESKQNPKFTLIQFSKYVYRIYLSLGKLTHNDLNLKEEWKKRELIFKNIIIPFRKTYDIKQADLNNIWIYFDYDSNDIFLEYLNKFKYKILKNVNDFLKKFD